MFNEKEAQRAIRFIEILKLTDDFHGQPFVLMDWQKQILSDVYGTMNQRGVRQFRTIYLEVAKKNAKSQLVGGIALKHLFDKKEPNGQIYGCAGDKQQAALVYDIAVEMIDQNPDLEKHVKILDSKKRITNKETGSFYQVVSAEAFTKHGLNVSVCIFDELHVQPNRQLWDVMTKGAGLARRQPIWWVITTAGDDPDRLSIGWEVHEKAAAVIKARQENDEEHDIPTWYPKIYSYLGEDIFNPKNWGQANPALGITLQVEDLQTLADEAKLSPADERLFRWLNLNQWVTTKLTAWLPIDLFDATNGRWSRKDLLGKECYMGMDLSSTTDLTTICMIFPPQADQSDWRVIWDCWIPEEGMQDRIKNDHVPYDQWARDAWISPTPGNVVDYNRVEERILELKKLYKIKEIDADRSFAAMLLQRLEAESLACVDIPQTYVSLTDAMNLIEVLLKNKKLTHEANPVARWCFGNTSISKNGNAQIKYVKERKGKGIDRTKRIDLTAAWVCGMVRARFHDGLVDISEKILDPEWGM
jgi:phage terminase large subunit-like protein